MDNPFSVETQWEQHQAPAYNFMRRMGLDVETSADLAQETMLRALRGAHRYRGEAPVRAWVLGIARNVFREWLRTGRREIPVAEVVAPPSDVSSSIEPLDVEESLGRLDAEHKEVLVLRFVLDLPSQDVAYALGITDDAVRQRVARAKAAFREVWST